MIDQQEAMRINFIKFITEIKIEPLNLLTSQTFWINTFQLI